MNWEGVGLFFAGQATAFGWVALHSPEEIAAKCVAAAGAALLLALLCAGGRMARG